MAIDNPQRPRPAHGTACEPTHLADSEADAWYDTHDEHLWTSAGEAWQDWAAREQTAREAREDSVDDTGY